MIVARQFAETGQYALPMLGSNWYAPYTLAVGPTLVLPVASTIQLFGFSVAAVRIAMVLYMLAATLGVYAFAARVGSRTVARWSVLLLMSLSAFVNTGKPMLGEVPGIAFMVLGLVLSLKPHTTRSALLVGFLFGLSFLTKLTDGLILPALGLALLPALWLRERKEVRWILTTLIVTCAVYAPWRLVEMHYATGLGREFAFMFSGDTSMADLVHQKLAAFVRPQFGYYALFFLAAAVELQRQLKTQWKNTARRTTLLTTAGLILLFTIYCLSSFGWYRHLLPAHVLLLPFAVATLLRYKRIGVLIMGAAILFQLWWQLTDRGATRSDAATIAAAYVEENFQGKPIIVQQAEVFVRLPQSPQWLFLTNPKLSSRLDPALVTPNAEQRCFPVLRTLNTEEQANSSNTMITGKYGIIAPPADCKNVAG